MSTLRFYTALASYGLCASLATAITCILGNYVLLDACLSDPVRKAWLLLLEVWLILVRDPHNTTPEHVFWWGQIIGRRWGDDVLKLFQYAKSHGFAIPAVNVTSS